MDFILEYHSKTRTLPAYIDMLLSSIHTFISSNSDASRQKIYDVTSKSAPMSQTHLSLLSSRIRTLITPSQAHALAQSIVQNLNDTWASGDEPMEEDTMTDVRPLGINWKFDTHICPTIWAVVISSIPVHIASPSAQDEIRTTIRSAYDTIAYSTGALLKQIDDSQKRALQARGQSIAVDQDTDEHWLMMVTLTAMFKLLYRILGALPNGTSFRKFGTETRMRMLEVANAQGTLSELRVEIVSTSHPTPCDSCNFYIPTVPHSFGICIGHTV